MAGGEFTTADFQAEQTVLSRCFLAIFSTDKWATKDFVLFVDGCFPETNAVNPQDVTKVG